MLPKSRIARRYWRVLAGFIAGAAIVFGIVQGGLVYRTARLEAARLQASELGTVAAHVEAGLQAVVGSLRQVCRMPWSSPLLTSADQRAELQRLLQRHPAVVEVQATSADGRETAFVSRLTMDRIESLRAVDPPAVAVGAATLFGPVFFRDRLAPHVKIACREEGVEPGAAIVAEMNLEFISDVVGESGRRLRGDAFLLDEADRVIAHSRQVAVFSAGDATALGAAPAVEGAKAPVSRWMGGPIGGSLVSAIGIADTPWRLAVSQPWRVVLAPAMQSVGATVAVGLLLAGLSALVALWLAARLTHPIRSMSRAVTAIAEGQLDHRVEVRTGDELEELANEINFMAGQLEEYTGGLERMVDERTEELKAAMRARALFLAAASHDLRQPLVGISLMTSQLAHEALSAEGRDLLAKQKAALEALSTLFDDLLDLSRFDSQNMSAVYRDVPLVDMLASDCSQYEVICGVHGLAWRCELPDVWLRTDPQLFLRLVRNLLSNAVRYTSFGGIALVGELAGDRVKFRISDTGSGIAPEDQDRVFEDFVRLGEGPHGADRGTGLGLAIVKRIADLLQMNLALRSTKGEGSTFSFEVPVAREAAESG